MSLETSFTLTMEFLSDWQIGTGLGSRGSVDATVRRDQDGLPFVPAKSIIGVWRDACETVATTFDRASTGSHAWQDWVTWIFGHRANRCQEIDDDLPAPAAMRITPARLAEPIRAAAGCRPALAQAAVVLRPGVHIDERTGTAADRFLRVEERALRGLVLTARVELAHQSTNVPEPAEILLRSGARLVEAIGGKRNRGAGRVAVLLPGARVERHEGQPTMVDPVLAELLALEVPGKPPRPRADVAPDAPHPYGRRHDGDRRTVRMVLRTLTPVVAGESVISNIVTSRDVIPGTALLGTVLANVRSAGPVGIDDVAVGEAVPAVGDLSDLRSVTPSLPAPRVWSRTDKGSGKRVFCTLDEPAPERAKPMDGRIVRDGEQWRPVEMEFTVSTHAVVDDKARRPTSTGGGVYTYLGIPPNTLLTSDVVLPTGARLDLEPGRQLRFGRSRKDDFGLVEVIGVVEVTPQAAPPVPGKTIRVLCRSDVLLRGQTLAPDPSPQALARALDEIIGSASVTVAAPGADTDTDTDTSVVRRDGFTVAWGRPRPSRIAMAAGSVVTISVEGPVDPAQLAKIERDGIGERTAEGFGRIAFDPPELTLAEAQVPFAAEPFPVVQRGTACAPEGLAAADPVHPIELNAWRRAIRQAATDLAAQKSGLPGGLRGLEGSRAQLGELRAQLERLNLPGGDLMIQAWLDGLESEPDRQKTWKSVPSELGDLLHPESDTIWTLLGFDAAQQRDLVLGTGRERLMRTELRTEAIATALTEILRGILHRNDLEPLEPEVSQ